MKRFDRLAEIFARMGSDIPDSTLVDWCRRAMKLLKLLIYRIEAEVMVSGLLHADVTPIGVWTAPCAAGASVRAWRRARSGAMLATRGLGRAPRRLGRSNGSRPTGRKNRSATACASDWRSTR